MEPARFEGNPGSTVAIRTELHRLIKERSFIQKRIVLASGKESDYYLDMKPTMFHPEGIVLLAKLILQKLEGLKVDYIGGLEMGAVPLIGPIALVSHEQGKSLPGFFVRKEIKTHGTMKRIEGPGPEGLKGKKVVILDDVTTSGGSAWQAVEAVQNAGAKVILVLSIVDRQEGADEFFKAKGLRFESLFRASDFR